MVTDHPTTELYFVFAFTYCRMKVYIDNEAFAQKHLEAHPGVEMCGEKESNSWQEVDTRLLLALVSEAFAQTTSHIQKAVEELRSVLV